VCVCVHVCVCVCMCVYVCVRDIKGPIFEGTVLKSNTLMVIVYECM